MKVINIDRRNSLPGCGPFDFDRAIVVSETETEPHIITGEMQPKILFRGTLAEAHAWVRSQALDELVREGQERGEYGGFTNVFAKDITGCDSN